MFIKSCLVGGPLLLGALWAGGVIGGPAYSRDVARPIAEVARGLADLDLTRQPGAPGTDPARSGGVATLFRLEQHGNDLRWVVTSGQQVATTMIATLTPIDATHTRVTARVERGDAPDDVVAPAFRSKGITLGLFSVALEDELNDLTKPAQMARADCDALFERLMADNFAAGGQRDPGTLSGAIGQTTRTVIKLSAIKAEAHRQGCEPHGFDDTPMVAQMQPADPNDPTAADNQPVGPGQTSFRPGAPMVNPNPNLVSR